MALNINSKNINRQLKLVHDSKIITYDVLIDTKKLKELKEDLNAKYAITKQIKRNDVIMNNDKNMLEVIYEFANHFCTYGFIEIIDCCNYNTRTSQNNGVVSYGAFITNLLATVKELPGIYVASELSITNDDINFIYLIKYIEQYNAIKSTESMYSKKIIALNLVKNNIYNITSKERKITIEELKNILRQVIECLIIINKQEVSSYSAADIKLANNNTKLFNYLNLDDEIKEKVMIYK